MVAGLKVEMLESNSAGVLQNGQLIDLYHIAKKTINDLKRVDNPHLALFREFSHVMFIASLLMGIFWLLEIVERIGKVASPDTINKTGLILQLIGTLSVLPELLRQQQNDRLQNLIRMVSDNLDQKIKFREVYDGKIFLVFEQDGIFGVINLLCQIWFVFGFVFVTMPSNIVQSETNPVLILRVWIIVSTLMYFSIIGLWIFRSMIYWGSKLFNFPISENWKAKQFFLNLFFITGVIFYFSLLTVVVWMIIKLLNWFSKFPLKRLFVIVTFPAVFTGLILQLFASYIK